MELESDYEKNKKIINSESENITHVEYSEDMQTEKDNHGIIESRAPHRDQDLDSEYTEEYVEQSGGSRNDESLDYLDDYSSTQYNKKKLDSYEKEFKMIFDKAQEYRKRIMQLQQNIKGGKKEPSKGFKLYVEMAKTLKGHIHDNMLKQKDFMKISKMIIDDVKRRLGTTEITDKVREDSLKIASNPGEYVKKYKEKNLSEGTQKYSTKNNKSMRGGVKDNDRSLTEYFRDINNRNSSFMIGGEIDYNSTQKNSISKIDKNSDYDFKEHLNTETNDRSLTEYFRDINNRNSSLMVGGKENSDYGITEYLNTESNGRSNRLHYKTFIY
jgi:hypothetical protein